MSRRHLMQGVMTLPLTRSVLQRTYSAAQVEPPTLLWEMFALLPMHDADGKPVRLTGFSGEMIFPGLLRSTRGILPAQVRPILEADTHHMLDVRPVTPDESLVRFCGVGLEGIDAIATFQPCTVFIGNFSTEEVHAAWKDIGYARTGDTDIWSWKGLSEREMEADDVDTLLVMQQRLALPPRSWGRYRFLTCIDDRYIVEAETGAMLRHIRDRYANRDDATALAEGPFGSSSSVPASTGHVAKLYEDTNFVSLRRPEFGSERGETIRHENEKVLTSIEEELGRMPRIRSALLGITPGAPWHDPLAPGVLPDLVSASIVHIQLQSQQDADQYLAIATARFEALVSPYTESPYPDLFSFEGNASGSRVTINLGHIREPRYDILEMSYVDDLAFLTWEPDDRDTWRSAQ